LDKLTFAEVDIFVTVTEFDSLVNTSRCARGHSGTEATYRKYDKPIRRLNRLNLTFGSVDVDFDGGVAA
jgi:hypothetical protein